MYFDLAKQHNKSLDDINKLYKIANKQYGNWLKINATLNKDKLNWWDKLKIWWFSRF